MSAAPHDEAASLLRAGRYDDAAALCERLLATAAEDGRLLNVLGAANLHRGRTHEALVAFRRHTEVAPKDATAFYNLGVAQQNAALYEPSLASLRQAIALRGGAPYGDAQLAACISAMHVGTGAALGAAQEHARAAVEQMRDSADARMWYAKALTAGNDKVAAAREFRAALVLRPGFTEALEGLVDALLENGELADAVAALDQLIELQPHHPTARADRTRAAAGLAPAAKHRRHRIVRYPKLAREFDDLDAIIERDLVRGFAGTVPVLGHHSRVFTMGSCFAANIANALRNLGVDATHVWYPDEINSTYANLRLLEWLRDGDLPRYDNFVAQFGSGGRDRMRATIEACDLVIVSLGVAPCFFDRDNGEFVATLGMNLSLALLLEHYTFRTTTVAENVANLTAMLEILRSLRPAVNVVVTVSPVPLNATFEMSSAIVADCISKSTLRVAAHEFTAAVPDVTYWPSFEMVRWLGGHTGPVFGNDDGSAGHVSQALIEKIMAAFIGVFGDDALKADVSRRAPGRP